MNIEDCAESLRKLFSAFNRTLEERVLEDWFEALERFHASDLSKAVWVAKKSDKLPVLGEIIRLTADYHRRSQAAADYQARAHEEGPNDRDKEGIAIITSLLSEETTYEEVCKKINGLVETPVIPLTGDLSEDHETVKTYKRIKWKQELSKLRGLKRAGENQFEPG